MQDVFGGECDGSARPQWRSGKTTSVRIHAPGTIWQCVEELVGAGTTVLLTTHYMEEAERLADRIVVFDHGRVIAGGSADDLKDQVGGSTLEVRVSRADDLSRATAVSAGLDEGKPRIDRDRLLLSLPTLRGTVLLIAAGRRLEDAGIPLDDLGIRRPSPDDVLLTLTGSTGQDSEQSEAEKEAMAV